MSRPAQTNDRPRADDRAMPMSAAVLGVAGVLPFILLALAALFQYDERLNIGRGVARDVLVTYGVVIASFLGGVRWGVGLGDLDAKERVALFSVAVAVPLVAMVALFVPRPHELSILIALFLLLGISDVILANRGIAPRWYGTLRAVLTAIVVIVLIVALAFLPFDT